MTKHQGIFRGKKILSGLILCVIVLAVAFVISSHISSSDRITAKSLEDLLPAIQEGQPAAVAQARELAGSQWSRSLPTIQRMLAHPNWRMRATACKILAERKTPSSVGALIVRCCDRDWRVRAAGFSGLGIRDGSSKSAGLRNVPPPERERMLLTWLDKYDKEAKTPLGNELCDLFTEDKHVEFGGVLLKRCLSSHAAAVPGALHSGTSHQSKSWREVDQPRQLNWPPEHPDVK